MSAIVGIHHFNEPPIEEHTIQKMMQALQKYPADDVRIWEGNQISLGCHAQWITPESVNEQLPYHDVKHRLAIATDAILDNREDLFEQLQVDSALRASMTDSELIVLAYRRWGIDSPQYLVGDFAFIIWDELKQYLFGARDLLGNRTLYYHHNNRHFACATVIPPLFALSGFKRQFNESWLAEFLAIPSILDSSNVQSTAYNDVFHLPPAHSFIVANGILTIRQYASLVSPVESLRLRSNEEYEEALRSVFLKAVTSKLRSRKQVGSSLSGGLDSGAVVSFAAKALQKEGKILHTYSYVPPSDFVDWTSKRRFADERPYIYETVRHVGNIADHYLDFPNRSSWSEINDWLELLETPYKCFENSFWMSGIFEEAKKQDVGVLLTGAGGNLSISWGSAIDYYAHLTKRLRLVKLKRELGQFSNQIGIEKSWLLRMIVKTAFPLLDRSSYGDLALIHPDFARESRVYERLKQRETRLPDSTSDYIKSRYYEFKDLVFPHMTGKMETQLSLRYGIWERDPTYDPRVIRFCLSVPLDQYVQNGVDRSLIRRATKGHLPDRVRLNQRYRGVQGADWIHRMMPSWRMFTDELRQLCQDSVCVRLLNIEQVKKSLAAIGESPRPDQAFDSNARFLMRSLIVYRFMKQLA
ncbi:asparagine synthetase B [Paenibacillus sp. MWE-103]|uniref:asparagine synthase (glutamine-hydrolyzing) n=1 Tax=Paenibacillus artemisiicola TaxID=1172618 RepID=A0ABS3WI27_9BACL|nr:asparagine synthase-related protein [Paenibacillus artemisiicola]MBO7747790.1 asparagine synthetase B [Paenibacillus artemisiicola]